MEKNKIYRKSTCKWADKAEDLLRTHNIQFEIHEFSSKEEQQNFKEKYDVETTPLIYLDGEKVGGYKDLASHFGEEPYKHDSKGSSYVPVVAVFSVAALLAFANSFTLMSFMGYSLCLLAMLKMMDLLPFADSFKNYDLLSIKIPFYAKVYPFVELIAGLGFLSGLFPLMTGSISMTVGVLGCISIFKAVYVDKLDLNCACVGGNSKVPLGAVSFSENLIMTVMGAVLIFTNI